MFRFTRQHVSLLSYKSNVRVYTNVILANEIFKARNFKILRELKLYLNLLKSYCLSERYLIHFYFYFSFF